MTYPRRLSLSSRALVLAATLALLSLLTTSIATAGSGIGRRGSLPRTGGVLHGLGPLLDGVDPARPPLRPGLFHACPVDEQRQFVDDFGDPRYVGGFHRHQGIDIMAEAGTPIRTPFDGLAEASSSWAGGITVTVTSSRGVAMNAHLSRVGHLGQVRAGTIVGYVGNSGDARGHHPHDHFEWHPGGGPAVDPYRPLTRACSRPRHPAHRRTAGPHDPKPARDPL